MRNVCAWLIISLFSVGTAAAQVNGRLTGTVVDPSGASIPNAQVSVFLGGGESAIFTVRTNAEGRFDFASLRPEYYRLSVDASGFAKTVLQEVKVDPGRETALPAVTMEVATGAQMIEVVAGPNTVNTSNAEVAATVTQA
jgi:hypothetical protein